MRVKPQAFLATRHGYIHLRVVLETRERSYNSYHRLMKIPSFNVNESNEYKKIKQFIRDFPRENYVGVEQISCDIIDGLYKMYKSGLLKEFDYSPLLESYEKVHEVSPTPANLYISMKEFSFFKKKINVSSSSIEEVDSELDDIIRREEKNGFHVVRKSIKKRTNPNKEVTECSAEFIRAYLPFNESQKIKSVNPVISNSGFRVDKYLIISDLHIPFHNSSLLYAILSMCEYENIKGLIINGDLVDFDFISSYERSASQISQSYIEDSLNEVLGWINLFSERFDKKIYIDGNHDDRVRRSTLGDGIRAFIPSMYPDDRMKSVPYNSVAGLFLLPVKGFECYSYGEYFLVGNYQIHHGEETGQNISKDRVYYNSVVGHTHRSEVAYNPIYNEDGSYYVRSKTRTGCLVDLGKDIPAKLAKTKESWVNGFSVLTHFSTDVCSVENVVCDKNNFIYRDKIWNF